jgi:hypothetical protein
MLGVVLLLPASSSAGTRSSTISIAGGTLGTATAKCPKGQRATGGGFLTLPADGGPGGTDVEVFESRKIGQRSWRASAFEGVVNSAGPLTVYVYCSRDASKTEEKFATVSLPDDAGNAVHAVDASCGSAGKARAGGFLIPTPPSSTATAHISDSFRLGSKSWRSAAIVTGGSPTLTSYVYCAKSNALKATSGSVASAVHMAPGTAVSGQCKHRSHALAGGFSQPDANPAPFGFGPNWLQLYEVRRSGKTWRTSAEHVNGNSTLVSTAYCG